MPLMQASIREGISVRDDFAFVTQAILTRSRAIEISIRAGRVEKAQRSKLRVPSSEFRVKASRVNILD